MGTREARCYRKRQEPDYSPGTCQAQQNQEARSFLQSFSNTSYWKSLTKMGSTGVRRAGNKGKLCVQRTDKKGEFVAERQSINIKYNINAPFREFCLYPELPTLFPSSPHPQKSRVGGGGVCIGILEIVQPHGMLKILRNSGIVHKLINYHYFLTWG